MDGHLVFFFLLPWSQDPFTFIWKSEHSQVQDVSGVAAQVKNWLQTLLYQVEHFDLGASLSDSEVLAVFSNVKDWLFCPVLNPLKRLASVWGLVVLVQGFDSAVLHEGDLDVEDLEVVGQPCEDVVPALAEVRFAWFIEVAI